MNKHDLIYEALIFAANEKEDYKIEDTFLFMKKVWYFYNSDEATYNGEKIEKMWRFSYVNPVLIGEPNWSKFYEADVGFCSTQNNIILKDKHFINSMIKWINKIKGKYGIARETKLIEYEEFLNLKLNNSNADESHYKYQNIFISNGFEVFKSMKDEFNLNERSRTDLRFTFDIMKENGMIHENVQEVYFREKWFSGLFSLDIEKISYADLKNTNRLRVWYTAKTIFIKPE